MDLDGVQLHGGEMAQQTFGDLGWTSVGYMAELYVVNPPCSVLAILEIWEFSTGDPGYYSIWVEHSKAEWGKSQYIYLSPAKPLATLSWRLVAEFRTILEFINYWSLVQCSALLEQVL